MPLKVEPAKKYGGSFPPYHLPIEIGHFSLNSDGKFCNDKHQLRYLVLPSEMRGLHMDLDEGISKHIYPTDDSEFNYSMILRWIVAHQDEIKKHFVDRFTSRVDIDFVCYRGVLKRICSAIYENLNDCLIIAQKYKSTIYLAEREEDEESESESENIAVKGKKVPISKREREMCAWGYKFEQYMTSDTVNSKPNTSVPVNENEKFYTVMKGKYGNYTLLFGGELDAVDPAHFDVPGHDPTSVLRYVELKTSLKIDCQRRHRNFLRYKLFQWYLQSFLVGTPRVICGFKDDAGIVREIHTFNVRDMPEMAQGMWSAGACLNFGIRFLDFVKEVVVKDYTEVAYIFSWSPGTDIICKEMEGANYLFPEWYTKNLTFT